MAAGAPWLDVPYGGPSPETQQPVTLLLDQCSGRTWMLVLDGASFEWRELSREPEWAVVLERP